MVLNRQLQLKILEHLQNFYTAEPGTAKITQQEFARDPNFDCNLKYLYEHDLITGISSRTSLGMPIQAHSVSITKDGLDFLEDDGGLSAILKTVIVKFDVENIRKILEDKVIKSNIKEEQKKTLMDKIKGLSGEALKEIMVKLLTEGLKHTDELMSLIS